MTFIIKNFISIQQINTDISQWEHRLSPKHVFYSMSWGKKVEGRIIIMGLTSS